MRRDQAIAALRGYLPAMRRDFGVRRVALFGSTARDEAREDSDLDLLVEFDVVPSLDAFVGLNLACRRRARVDLRKGRSG